MLDYFFYDDEETVLNKREKKKRLQELFAGCTGRPAKELLYSARADNCQTVYGC